MLKYGKRKLIEYFLILALTGGVSFFAELQFPGFGALVFIFLSTLFILHVMHQNHVVMQQLIKEKSWEEQKANEAWHSINAFLRFSRPLSQLSSYAASPDFAQYIMAHVIKHKPAVIYELGCGFSTMIISKSADMYAQNTRLISLEADEFYLNKCKDELIAEGLEKYVELVHAPYQSIKIGDEVWSYYKLPVIEHKINFLIVDGPPKSIQKNSRYPAIHQFKQYLSDDAYILCDDATRDDLRETISRWKDENLDLVFENIPLTRGACLIYLKK